MSAPFRSWAEDHPRASTWRFDRDAYADQMRRRGWLERLQHRGTQDGAVARLILEGRQEEARRAADPVEQAKAVLRRRGYVVFAAAIQGGEDGQYIVGRRLLDRDGLLALAARLG